MGDLTRCNYCSLNHYKLLAKREGKRIVLKPSNFMNGIIVFAVPKGKKLLSYIEPNNKYPNGDKNYQKYWKSWMAEIGTYCSC